MRTFAAAADAGQFQEAISKRIAALENDLGVRLFTRTARGAQLDVIADSPALATFVGEQSRLVWPADYGLRRIATRGPTPVYPHSLIWHGDNYSHPALTTLRDYLGSAQPDHSAEPSHRDAET